MNMTSTYKWEDEGEWKWQWWKCNLHSLVCIGRLVEGELCGMWGGTESEKKKMILVNMKK